MIIKASIFFLSILRKNRDLSAHVYDLCSWIFAQTVCKRCANQVSDLTLELPVNHMPQNLCMALPYLCKTYVGNTVYTFFHLTCRNGSTKFRTQSDKCGHVRTAIWCMLFMPHCFVQRNAKFSPSNVCSHHGNQQTHGGRNMVYQICRIFCWHIFFFHHASTNNAVLLCSKMRGYLPLRRGVWQTWTKYFLLCLDS